MQMRQCAGGIIVRDATSRWRSFALQSMCDSGRRLYAYERWSRWNGPRQPHRNLCCCAARLCHVSSVMMTVMWCVPMALGLCAAPVSWRRGRRLVTTEATAQEGEDGLCNPHGRNHGEISDEDPCDAFGAVLIGRAEERRRSGAGRGGRLHRADFSGSWFRRPPLLHTPLCSGERAQ